MNAKEANKIARALGKDIADIQAPALLEKVFKKVEEEAKLGKFFTRFRFTDIINFPTLAAVKEQLEEKGYKLHSYESHEGANALDIYW